METPTFKVFRIGTLPLGLVAEGVSVPRTPGNIRRSTGARNEHDLSLLAQISLGKTLALLELYDLYQFELFSVAFGGPCDLECAEHAVRDTFLTVWSHSERFDPATGTVKAWLMRTVQMYAERECSRYSLHVVES